MYGLFNHNGSTRSKNKNDKKKTKLSLPKIFYGIKNKIKKKK